MGQSIYFHSIHVFTVQVIGNGNAFGENQKYHTCFLCDSGDTRFLIDCGATAIYNLERNHVDFNTLDLIIISHFHGDHYGGVPFILLNANYLLKRTRPLTIVGPAGVQERVEALTESLYPGILGAATNFDIHYQEYQDTPLSFNELKISALPVVHAPESIPHGVRVEGAKTLAFSGDTEWTENLVPLCDQSDLFICECNNYNANVNGHLSYHMILEKMNLLQSKRMILTHMGADMYENMENLMLELSEQDRIYQL